MEPDENRADPRIYLAAERTFLAWIRTAIALMAFGFVIARFGYFIRSIALQEVADGKHDSGFSIGLGLSLIAAGILLCIVSAIRHSRFITAIDHGVFRSAFGSRLAFGMAALLVLSGAGMAIYLFFL